jgi:hypothetical protein
MRLANGSIKIVILVTVALPALLAACTRSDGTVKVEQHRRGGSFLRYNWQQSARSCNHGTASSRGIHPLEARRGH